ncbi:MULTISPECIES: hypothetical protein [Chloroflexus]|uniref:hypothetical protein n=1 Tax=Chloroflexus TaxID=1107 RepID=UPI000037B58B|nr:MULTISPECIES: hypothetical protein [Chloroflexus]
MVWCLVSFATLCSGLAVLALTVKPERIRLPRLTLRRLLRGCLATTFLAAAAIFALLSYLLIT